MGLIQNICRDYSEWLSIIAHSHSLTLLRRNPGRQTSTTSKWAVAEDGVSTRRSGSPVQVIELVEQASREDDLAWQCSCKEHRTLSLEVRVLRFSQPSYVHQAGFQRSHWQDVVAPNENRKRKKQMDPQNKIKQTNKHCKRWYAGPRDGVAKNVLHEATKMMTSSQHYGRGLT